MQVLRYFAHRVVERRLLAALWFSVPALCVVVSASDMTHSGLVLRNTAASITLGMTGPVLAVLLVNRFSGQLDLSLYPQWRPDTWTRRRIAANHASWFVYLVAYEFFFRGYLLLYCFQNDVHPGKAIVVNVLLYAAAHLYKGWHESMLSIPFGVLLCLITLYTQNIWAAVAIHTAVAVTAEHYAITFIQSVKLK